MRQIKTVLLAMVLAVVPALMGLRSASAEPITLVTLGDSLTAGYGLGTGEGFAPRLEQALKGKGHDVKVIDAGVSGDTASGGLSRLDWAVPDGTRAVIVELGANDALRGIDPRVTEQALDQILSRLAARNIAVLLAGMMAPPNMGDDYARSFNEIYPRLAEKHGAVLYPFFLDGVAGNPALNLPDGMHPTAAGIDVIVERILPSVEQLLAKVR